MKFNSAIFNEMESYDVSEFVGDYEDDENMDILHRVCVLESGVDPNKDEYTEDEEELIQDSEPIKVWKIDLDSLLADGLCEWYKCNKLELADHVRSGVIVKNYHDSSEWYLFFASGVGYDVISNDLLGGSPDGQASRKFIDMLNSDRK